MFSASSPWRRRALTLGLVAAVTTSFGCQADSADELEIGQAEANLGPLPPGVNFWMQAPIFELWPNTHPNPMWWTAYRFLRKEVSVKVAIAYRNKWSYEYFDSIAEANQFLDQMRRDYTNLKNMGLWRGAIPEFDIVGVGNPATGQWRRFAGGYQDGRGPEWSPGGGGSNGPSGGDPDGGGTRRLLDDLFDDFFGDDDDPQRGGGDDGGGDNDGGGSDFEPGGGSFGGAGASGSWDANVTGPSVGNTSCHRSSRIMSERKTHANARTGSDLVRECQANYVCGDGTTVNVSWPCKDDPGDDPNPTPPPSFTGPV
ncbi:MAG: hypothetical protein AAGA56_26785 [Myxococcota bacterium]